MRARLPCLAVAALLLAVMVACGATGGDSRRAPRTSASYTLAQGQRVTLAPAVTLTLERINDSRCKAGAVCVWAGYISYSFVLRDRQGASRFTLAEDMPGASPVASVRGLRFTLLGLQPAAAPALHAPTPDYRVSLRVDISPPT